MLIIKDLNKTYKNGKLAVKNLNLDIGNGEIYGFIGQNGAGKTTTIKCVVGALDFESGEILIDGKSIKTNAIEAKKVIAYVPDKPNIYEFLTGIEYINYISDIFEVSIDERKERIQKYGDMLDMTKNLGDLISSYSHGMKQKIAIIAALVHNPKLLIFDEPFVGLDPVATSNFKKAMREMCKEGNSIFFSTHILEVAEKLCDKIAIIKNGELITSGEVNEVCKDKSLESLFLNIAEGGE